MENGILTSEEINIGNSLIAKFDGYTQKPNNSDVWVELEGGRSWNKLSEFSYDCAYDSLMPILDKISKLTIKSCAPYFQITNYGCSIELTKLSHDYVFRGVHGKDLITNIWVMIVEFLDWYFTVGIALNEEPSLYQQLKNNI